jgi:peptidoglycan/LPS O-acetylase OafA/YrhL
LPATEIRLFVRNTTASIAMDTPIHRNSYRREIDGLRAVAVLPVILFHAHLPWFAGGFVGVDIFFVISGYLITDLLLEKLDQGTYSLAGFYERRARRILPAFVVMMLCSFFAALIFMLPGEFGEFIKSFLASAIGVSNFYFLSQTGYFAPDADLQPLLHTWSLGIEEQYYLVFPPLLALLTWKLRRRRTSTLVGLTLAGFVLAETARHFDPQRSFFFTLTRTWELGLGSLCAIYASSRDLRGNDALALCGIALVSFSITSYDASVPFPSFYALTPTLGTCLIILFGNRQTYVGRLLSVRVLVGVGLVSYSAYLWHQPIFAFARLFSVESPSTNLMVGLSGLSLLVGWASWRWVEQPFRNPHRPLLGNRRRLFGASLSSILVLAVLGITAHQTQALRRDLWLQANPAVAHAYLLRERADKNRDFPDASTKGTSPSDCRFNTSLLDMKVASRINDCYARFGPGVMVVGDSHAIDFYGLLVSRFDDPFLIGITEHGCRAADPEPTPELDCPFDDVRNYLKSGGGAIDTLLYTQAGFYILNSDDGEPIRRSFFGRLSMNEKVPPTRPDRRDIDAVLRYLDELGQFTDVKWVGPRIEPHLPFNYFAKKGCRYPFALRQGQEKAFHKLDDYIGRRIKMFSRVSYVSQNSMIGFDWTKDYSDCHEMFFVDGDHYSAAGEVRFGSRIPQSLLE